MSSLFCPIGRQGRFDGLRSNIAEKDVSARQQPSFTQFISINAQHDRYNPASKFAEVLDGSGRITGACRRQIVNLPRLNPQHNPASQHGGSNRVQLFYECPNEAEEKGGPGPSLFQGLSQASRILVYFVLLHGSPSHTAPHSRRQPKSEWWSPPELVGQP